MKNFIKISILFSMVFNQAETSCEIFYPKCSQIWWTYFSEYNYFIQDVVVCSDEKYKDDNKIGEWILCSKDNDKVKYKIDFNDGLKNGFFTEYYDSGEEKLVFEYNNLFIPEEILNRTGITDLESKYVEGKLMLLSGWNEDGDLVIKDGTGIWTGYHTIYPSSKNKNPTISEIGYFTNGRKNGKWTYYRRNGTVYNEKKYKNGELIETVTYFGKTYDIVKECPTPKWKLTDTEVCIEKVLRDDGTLLWEKTWTTNYRHGRWTKYYSSGKKWYEGNYEFGKKVGIWTEWYESGKVKGTEDFTK